MVRDKEVLKKEIRSALRNVSILILSLVIINLGFSIASLFKFTDKRLIWTLDYGFYSIVLSVLFTIIHYRFLQKKLIIDVNIQNKKEEINQITINDDEYGEINIKLHISGKYKKISKPLEIIFPYWIDFQLRPKPYITEYDDENRCEIDLNYLVKQKKNVSLNETISFEVISNQSGKQDDVIEAVCNFNLFQKVMHFHIKNQGIKIKNKGGK
ncbi:hypothetical protein ABER02_11250 [Rossellomorea marisflavi]|uniref:hypothetical protein n=1 Tax=Rossellomorea marisflavi TaxID=189381 RepID=UPI003D2685A1